MQLSKSAIGFLIALLFSSIPIKADTELPDIGGSGYSIITLQQEYNLGRAWARLLRGQARIYEDALVSQYIEDLTWSLVSHSQLQDRRLEIVVLDNPTINAFAAPGGIIGVHSGLILTSKSEGQLASVLAHELAHLSQRHFAAQLEEQRRNKPFFLASLLGSILIAAADPEAGVAAIQSSMAASVSSKLSFSRQNEREADYIGMQTLTSAGYSPFSMSDMFKQLQESARFSRVPPEFLLTHPVTQGRISDALNRAEQFSGDANRIDSLDFNLMRFRVQANYAKDKSQLLHKYQALQTKEITDELSYAIAYTAIKDRKFEIARQEIARFSEKFEQTLSARLLKAELAAAEESFPDAIEQLKRLNLLYPGNHAISYLTAEAYLRLNQPDQASKVYRKLIENQPNDSRAWYLLAESYGLEGDILGVHEARIEYFLLTANVDRALSQIEYALKDPKLSEQEKAGFEQRKKDAQVIRKSLDFKY
ncbi:MAG: M48 family metalloprotease [Neptuniibacter sp.]